MYDLIRSLEFWIAIALASIIKIRAEPELKMKEAVSTIAVSVLAGLIFTPPILEFLELSGDAYKYATCSLVALTCDRIAKQILSVDLVELIKALRGK